MVQKRLAYGGSVVDKVVEPSITNEVAHFFGS
jgi:hypothetical protein